MSVRLLFTLCGLCLLLSACGYKGDLYLPKNNDKAQFGPLQTGLHLQTIQPQNRVDYD